MGKIFILIGKSASGKDAIYKELIADRKLSLLPYVGYTTRPMRTGEENGREYFFVSPDQLSDFENEGKLIEKRIYHTVHGDWTYFSVDTDYVDLNKHDYLYIGTLESYLPLRDYYGGDIVIPLYVYVEDGLRLQRALNRERRQSNPRYAELCRRFLVDEEDFAEDKLCSAGIDRRFENRSFGKCVAELKRYIGKRQESNG